MTRRSSAEARPVCRRSPPRPAPLQRRACDRPRRPKQYECLAPSRGPDADENATVVGDLEPRDGGHHDPRVSAYGDALTDERSIVGPHGLWLHWSLAPP